MKPVYYCQKHQLTTRIKQSIQLKSKYQDRVPIIVQPLPGSLVPWIKNCKFLAPKTSACSGLQSYIRENTHLKAEYALNYLIDTSRTELDDQSKNKSYQMLNGAELIGSVYAQFAKPDGFCYVYYDQEHFFG